MIVSRHGSSSVGRRVPERGADVPVPGRGVTEPAGPVTGTVASTTPGCGVSVQVSGMVAGSVAPPSAFAGVSARVSGPAMKATGPIEVTVAGGTVPDTGSDRSPDPGIGVDGAVRPDQEVAAGVPFCATVTDSRAEAVT